MKKTKIKTAMARAKQAPSRAQSLAAGGLARSAGTGENAGAEGDGRMTLLLLSLAAIPPAANDWALLGACFALAIAVLIFVFFIQPDASDLAPHRGELDKLLERRDTIYDNLRDLRFEYRAGKYSEGDYEAMKSSLELEAAQVFVEIDRVTEAQMKRPRGPKSATSEGCR